MSDHIIAITTHHMVNSQPDVQFRETIDTLKGSLRRIGPLLHSQRATKERMAEAHKFPR